MEVQIDDKQQRELSNLKQRNPKVYKEVNTLLRLIHRKLASATTKDDVAPILVAAETRLGQIFQSSNTSIDRSDHLKVDSIILSICQQAMGKLRSPDSPPKTTDIPSND